MLFADKKSNTLVIENDFIDRREKINPLKNMSKLKKSEIVESLEKYNLNKKINSKTTLVVNSFYNKKFDLGDMVINYESYEEILEAIDAQTKNSNFLKSAMRIRKINFEKEVIQKLENCKYPRQLELHIERLKRWGFIGHDDYSLVFM